MNKKHLPVILTLVIFVIVGIGTFFYFQVGRDLPQRKEDALPEATDQVGVEEVVEVFPAGANVLYEGIKQIHFQKFLRGTEISDINQLTAVPVNVENQTIYKGDFLAMLVVAEMKEGAFYNVESQIQDKDGWKIERLNIGLAPLEVTGGGLFTVCCFEALEVGEFRIRMRINGQLAAEVPFYVVSE